MSMAVFIRKSGPSLQLYTVLSRVLCLYFMFNDDTMQFHNKVEIPKTPSLLFCAVPREEPFDRTLSELCPAARRFLQGDRQGPPRYIVRGFAARSPLSNPTTQPAVHSRRRRPTLTSTHILALAYGSLDRIFGSIQL
jgi:hypothetical protein